MKVSIVIPNFNGRELLAKNLPAVILAAKDEEIIVVDDASEDGSLDFVRSNFPDIKTLSRRSNQGFSSTVNDGVKIATGDIIVLLNTDIVPRKDFLSHLIKHFNDSKVFAVGCLQECSEGKRTVLRGRGIGKFLRGFLVHARGEVNKASTLWVSGGAGAFRRSIWIKLDGMDELYNPFYWEDIDLCYRALKSGYSTVFEKKSVVNHGQHTGAIRTHYQDFVITSTAYRNQFIFFWKNITEIHLLLSHLLWLPYHSLVALRSANMNFFKRLFEALWYLPAIIVRRLKMEKMVKSDTMIVEPFKDEFYE